MSTDPKWHGYTDQHVRARVSMCADTWVRANTQIN